jgi:cyclic beta-1,2-glucan synthetase
MAARQHYLVEESIFQVRRDLPRRFYKALPTMEIAQGVRVPRVLAIAWVYVAHCDSTVSSQSLKAIVDGFQSVQPMLIGELWALPSMLRFVLVENLRRIAMRVRRAHQMRQLANEVADKVLAAKDGEDRTEMLAGFAHAQDMTLPRRCSIACATVRKTPAKR